MVYSTQNYMGVWTSSIVRSSSELKHDVSETGSVSVLRLRREKTRTQLDLRLAPSKGLK
jgi:hypothetical protein